MVIFININVYPIVELKYVYFFVKSSKSIFPLLEHLCSRRKLELNRPENPKCRIIWLYIV